METFHKLVEWFVKNGGDRAIVALSGGVDSAVVALAAKKALGKGAIAITADYTRRWQMKNLPWRGESHER